jgi:O-acetyl-ADP-ribose deacetylase (regulator of RNase III)
VKAQVGDLTQFEAEVLVNAANGQGYMGGGVAGALRRRGGPEIEAEAIRVCRETNPQTGQVYVTGAGKTPARFIYHAVTMLHPAERSSPEIVEQCLYSVLEKAREQGITTIGIPALGTGVGRVPKAEVAEKYLKVLGPVTDIEITVLDIDREFIKLVNAGLKS